MAKDTQTIISARQALSRIQVALKAKKDHTNEFGGYKYRNKEGIFEAVKPLLDAEHATIVINDDISAVGDRVYVKSVATFSVLGSDETISSQGCAREAAAKKGMDEAQITGAASSYAGKYALCNLLAIDDSADDPDSRNDHGKRLPTLAEVCRIAQTETPEELRALYSEYSRAGLALGYVADLCKARKSEIEQTLNQ